MIQKNQNIFFTIIIPHHNLPFLLKRCLDSIPQREDLEVIVVDDKSSEENICKLREIEPLYSNVKFLYSRINGGGGFARNIGLEETQGKYVIFSDSDDFFCTEFNSILNESKRANADMYFFNVQTLDSETLKPVPIHHQLNDYIDNWSEDKEYAEMQLRYKFGEPWCKIVKKEIIINNKIQFDEIRVHNDTRFSYLVGYYASKICVDKRVGYTYLVREGSVSKNRDISRDYIKINVFGKSSKFFKEHGLPVDEDRHWRALYHLLSYKPRSNFNNGILILKGLGYSRKEIVWGYAKGIAQCGFYSPIRSFFCVPLLSIRITSIIAWFIYSVPSRFRDVLLGAKKRTLF